MTLTAHISRVSILAALLICAGCAVPGEPLPPLLDIPAPVTSLTAQQTGTGIDLRFPIPQLTTEGTRPRRMERIELLVAYASPGAPPPDMAKQGAVVKTWTAGEIPEGTVEIGHRESVSGEHAGNRAWFAVRAKNQRGVDAGLSNIVAVDVVNLPASPTGIIATVTETAVVLRWSASPHSAFGGASATGVEYEIFRAPAEINTAWESIGKSPGTTYSDSTFSFRQSYRYSIRAIIASDVSTAVTGLAAPVEVSALDRFSPAAPANLRAIAVTGAVELAWSPNSEADLAGYNVYREQQGAEPTAPAEAAAPRRKLNAALLDIPLFRDETAAANREYRYTVTTVDAAGNESPVSNEESVETE